jgi:AraC family transcriptional regulator
MSNAVDSAITRIWEGYSEPLSLADIAKSAILSRFHFSRVFRDATGVSPGRFLSAVRIYQAKRLLASTSLSVTDISLAVGYNSLGSFTNRFTESVGASPSRFRRMCRDGIRPAAPPAGAGAPEGGAVTGALSMPADYETARVYIGLFDTPIIQREPASSIIIDARHGQSARYRLANVPPGEWYVRAVAAADSADPEPWTRRALLLGGQGPVTVSAAAATIVDVDLHPRSRSDLPILFAVPDLEPRIIAPAGDARHLPEAELLPPAAFAAAAGR